MDDRHIQILNACTEDTIPDLDIAVLGALELFAAVKLPTLTPPQVSRLLVLGSGNADVAGRVLFDADGTIFANEGNYTEVIAHHPDIDGAAIISASGGKHAISMAKLLKERTIPIWLYTSNPNPPAGEYVAPDRIFVFPKNREPYTYNTSTYLGMILAKTGEDPAAIYRHITEVVAPLIPDTLDTFDSFYLILPPAHGGLRGMFLTKFDELFGSVVGARAYTMEQTKHAKTIVPSQTELFVSFGEENTLFGEAYARLHIPLPPDAGSAMMITVTYFVIGHIQKQHPGYFKEHIGEYAAFVSNIFGQTITPIVD